RLAPEATLESTGTGRADITHYEAERIDIKADAPAPGAWLVLSEMSYPGWTASVDGRPTEVARADALFRAVWVPAGRHEVVFRYRPRSFEIGLMVSALSVLALAAAWWRARSATASAVDA